MGAPRMGGPPVRTQPSAGDPKGPKALYSPSTVGSPVLSRVLRAPQNKQTKKKQKGTKENTLKKKKHFLKEKGGT